MEFLKSNFYMYQCHCFHSYTAIPHFGVCYLSLPCSYVLPVSNPYAFHAVPYVTAQNPYVHGKIDYHNSSIENYISNSCQNQPPMTISYSMIMSQLKLDLKGKAVHRGNTHTHTLLAINSDILHLDAYSSQ